MPSPLAVTVTAARHVLIGPDADGATHDARNGPDPDGVQIISWENALLLGTVDCDRYGLFTESLELATMVWVRSQSRLKAKRLPARRLVIVYDGVNHHGSYALAWLGRDPGTQARTGWWLIVDWQDLRIL